MFTGLEHPYGLQLAALWCSFVPGLATLGLLIGAQMERSRRRCRPTDLETKGAILVRARAVR